VTFDVGPRFAGPARDGCCDGRARRFPAAKEQRMKEVERKDQSSVPGGYQLPGVPGDIGPSYPAFPIVPEYPTGPTVPFTPDVYSTKV
jgi:hypothetical protein